MPYTLGIFKVEDYAKWKSGFDSEDSIAMRKASGMKSYQLFQTEDDPNNIVILVEWDNLDTARKFLQSDELQEALQRSGVPQIERYFLEEVEKGSI